MGRGGRRRRQVAGVANNWGVFGFLFFFKLKKNEADILRKKKKKKKEKRTRSLIWRQPGFSIFDTTTHGDRTTPIPNKVACVTIKSIRRDFVFLKLFGKKKTHNLNPLLLPYVMSMKSN